ncbi:MAG TPA: aminodeoxychorismate lyase [Gammaproteobacteria bacterium]|nr:aminodeoxychorismate lyase [Gammaproteobacteria bacterium]
MGSDPFFGHFVNGEPGGLDPQDRGLAYGDGLFETMASRDGAIRFIDYHLERLAHGCRRLAMPIPDLGPLRNELIARCPPSGQAVVKLVVTRGVGERGYRAPEPAKLNRIVSVAPWSGYPAEHYTRGVNVELCALRLAENPQLAGLKHLCRLEQVLAQMELGGRSADEGLLRDRSGFVVGGISSNVFCVRGRRLVTPPLLRCGVHGVMRRIVLEHAAAAELEPAEEELTTAQLLESDEVFMTNAVAGIRPVRVLAGRRFAIGPRTRALMRRLEIASDA